MHVVTVALILAILILTSCTSNSPKPDEFVVPPESPRPPCTFKIYQGDPLSVSLRRAQSGELIDLKSPRFGTCSCLCDQDFENFLKCGSSASNETKKPEVNSK